MITTDPNMMAGLPCIRPRVPVVTVVNMLRAEAALQPVLAYFHHAGLTVVDVLEACAHAGYNPGAAVLADAIRKLALEQTRAEAEPTTLPQLQRATRAVNAANGWEVPPWESQYGLPAMLALVTSEVSEALEAFRKNDRANFEEELADIVIRVMDLCAALGVDLEAQVLAKLKKNAARSHRHGGKRV